MPPRSDAFLAALGAAVRVLATMPRGRAEVAAARECVSRLRATHPSVRIDVAIDLEPGSNAADYDLLVEHPDGGTVALSYRPDRGNPWLVDYAEHWAANYVLSVGDANVPVTVQQALTALELKTEESPALVDSLVDDALVERAMEIDPPEVTPEELQAAVDAVRASRGLHNAAATHAWLRRLGWSVEQLQTLVENAVRVRKMSERLTAEQIEPHFLAHRPLFDVVRLFRAATTSADLADRLAALGRQHGLLNAAEHMAAATGAVPLEGSLSTVRAHELAPELAEASVRHVIGPIAARGRWWVAEVLSRQTASLDASTRAAVRDVLFRRWLDDQRAGREIRWHWL